MKSDNKITTLREQLEKRFEYEDSEKQLNHLLNLLNEKIKEYNILYYSFYINSNNQLAKKVLYSNPTTVRVISTTIKSKVDINFAVSVIIQQILICELRNQLKDLLNENELLGIVFDQSGYFVYFKYNANIYQLRFNEKVFEYIRFNNFDKTPDSIKFEIDYLQGTKYVSGKQFTINQPDYDILITTPISETNLKYKVTRESFELKDLAEKVKKIDTILENIPDHETY